jgi:energy-coupling factor transport system permease protein
MLNNLPLGIYLPGDSLLHRLQARTKVLLLLWLVPLLFLSNQRHWRLGPYVAVLVLLVLAVWLSHIRPGYLLKRMRLVLLLLLLAAIPTLLFTPGDTTIANLGPFVISSDGAWVIVGFSSIFVFIFLASQLVALTTSPVALAEGLALLLRPLRRLRLPSDEFALMTLIALRFLPLLIDEADQLIKAQQARGASFSQGSLRKRGRAILALLVPMLHGALRRAGELAVALESRGYGLGGEQTMLYETRLHRRDYLTLAVVIVPTLVAFILF